MIFWIENWKTKYCTPNNSKHSLTLICSQFFLNGIFILLVLDNHNKQVNLLPYRFYRENWFWKFLSPPTNFHPQISHFVGHFYLNFTINAICLWIPQMILAGDCSKKDPRVSSMEKEFPSSRSLQTLKSPIHTQLKWAILLRDVIPDGKTE